MHFFVIIYVYSIANRKSSFKSQSGTKLQWKTKPKDVLFLVKKDVDITDNIITSIEYLHSCNMTLIVEDYFLHLLNTYQEENINIDYDFHKILSRNDYDITNIDFIVTFGGDGLVMHCNTLYQEKKIPPTMCFGDFGSMGFLAPFRFADFRTEIDKLLDNETSYISRMRLECSIYRNNELQGKLYCLECII